jgi:ketosteroid isomerase-like protein
MSQDHVQAIRGVYGSWSEGDFRASAGLMDPLVLFVMGEGLPETGAYLGVDGLAEYMRGFLEPWARITIEAEDVTEAGDSVVVAIAPGPAGRPVSTSPRA